VSKAEDFVHLHVHADMSQLDGCGKVADYVKATKERGAPAIAITDHGTMRGYYQQLLECQEHGVKPIYGIEFYVAMDMHRKGITPEERAEITQGMNRADAKNAVKGYEEHWGIRDRWHITVWAKNAEGLRNLYRLSTMGWTEGFYYKPRIDLKALMEHGDGLAVATGCLSSPINDRVATGKKRMALADAEKLRERFGEDLWLEVQPHAIDDQRLANQFALDLRERWGKHARLLATQDAHYVDQKDADAHEVMLCIGTGDRMSNPDRFRFGNNEFHLRTRAEMKTAFQDNHEFMSDKVIKEALDNTLLFNSMIEPKIINIDRFACLMPALRLPSEYGGYDATDAQQYQYLKELCIGGWSWRDIPSRAAAYARRMKMPPAQAVAIYRDRLKMELGALKRQRFIGYFLLVRDLYDWVRRQNIACGPGRGSAAGSIVSFLLGITSVDPIEHGLIFERFISPSRIDMPDIDMDFEDVRRQEIIDHLREKYGADKVCQIATVGKLSGKQCLKDVSRVLDVPYAEVNAVTASIIERSSGDERASQTIEDSFAEFKVCQEFNAKYPDVLRHAKRLEGMAKTLGIHAAGVITSPVPLTDLVPLEIRKHEGKDVVVSAIDMYGVAAMGLLKLDVLGLRTLTVLNDCVKAIKERHGVDIDLEKLDLNEPDVLQGFTDHDYVGIFQYDSPGADKICSGVEFNNFEDIAAMTALNRPGTARSGLATQYVARKKDPKLIKKSAFGHPLVDEITKDTLGIIVYQEHVLKIFTQVAGFPPATADSLRKKIAKKWGDETIGKERQNFIEGAKATCGMDAKTAGRVMDAITFFGCLPSCSCVVVSLEAKRNDNGSQEDAESQANREPPTRRQIHGCEDKEGMGERASMAHGAEDRPAVDKSGASDPQGRRSDEQRHRQFRVDNGARRANLQEENWRQGEAEWLLDDQDGEWLGAGAQSGHGKDDWSEAVVQRDGASYRRRHDEQHSGQSGDNSTRAAHILSSEGLKTARADMHLFGVRQSHIQQEHVFDALFSELQAETKAISDLKPGDSIVSLDSEGRPTENRVKTVARTGVRRQFDIKLTGGQTLACSPDHWWNTDKGWMKANDLYPGVRMLALGSSAVVVEVRDIGVESMWDIECEHGGELANYLVCSKGANPQYFQSHNSYGFNRSHAVCYAVIAYWGMWLKRKYPLEFYWALLKNEPQRLRIQQIAKDVKRHDIELLPPSVSMSKKQFAIDSGRRAIRGSLVDIKGVGEAAATTIMENQPYKGLFDFLARVDRRKCHKGVVLALARAGALDEMLPNIKQFIEGIEDFWKVYNKKDKEGLRELLKQWAAEPDYADEERQLIASQVNPLAFGKHPVDAYGDFISKNIKVPIAAMSDEDFWVNNDGAGVFIVGVVVEVKYNQVGDFHTGELPSAEERRDMFWGARYANVNVEDVGGKQNRIKVDFDIFDDFREVVDAGVGTPVVVHASANARYENLRAHFLLDLEVYRKKVNEGAPLTVWERIIAGQHPSVSYPWADKQIKYKGAEGEVVTTLRASAITNQLFELGLSSWFTGVITHVRLKYDKNSNEMAFFGIIDGIGNYIDVICFASAWDASAKKHIKAGNHLRIQLDRKKDRKSWQYFLNNGAIKLLKKSAKHARAA